MAHSVGSHPSPGFLQQSVQSPIVGLVEDELVAGTGTTQVSMNVNIDLTRFIKHTLKVGRGQELIELFNRTFSDHSCEIVQ